MPTLKSKVASETGASQGIGRHFELFVRVAAELGGELLGPPGALPD
jgi:hypothetical protein